MSRRLIALGFFLAELYHGAWDVWEAIGPGGRMAALLVCVGLPAWWVLG